MWSLRRWKSLAAFVLTMTGACANNAPEPSTPGWGPGYAAPNTPYPAQPGPYPGQYQGQAYPPGQYRPPQYGPPQYAPPPQYPPPQYGPPPQYNPPQTNPPPPQPIQLPTLPNLTGWLPQLIPQPQPNQPAPNPLPLPTPVSPGTTSSCIISETAQTWNATMKCTGGNGACQRNEKGALVIQRTGPSTALVVAEGQYRDPSATFDPNTCTVSHSGLKPQAAVDMTINYAVVIDGSGALSGNADVRVNDLLLGCSGKFAVSGTKK